MGEHAYLLVVAASGRKDSWNKEFGPILTTLLRASKQKLHGFPEDIMAVTGIILVKPLKRQNQLVSSGNAETSWVIKVPLGRIWDQACKVVPEHRVCKVDVFM